MRGTALGATRCRACLVSLARERESARPGEPLHNYEAVLASVAIATHELGLHFSANKVRSSALPTAAAQGAGLRCRAPAFACAALSQRTRPRIAGRCWSADMHGRRILPRACNIRQRPPPESL